MSCVWFHSDLHLGHKSVINFHDQYRSKCMGVDTIEQHDEKIFDMWATMVRKRDKIYILGDIGDNIEPIKKMPGTKILLLGNHDKLRADNYLEIFDDIIGPVKYKKHWINHFPIHESELWNRPLIHGHTHSHGVEDKMYINVCCEMTQGLPIRYQDILAGKFTTFDRVNKPFNS